MVFLLLLFGCGFGFVFLGEKILSLVVVADGKKALIFKAKVCGE
jgi:hypothetical protein